MKVVLDTNVFVSGVFFTGPPYQILKAWRDSIIQIVVSPPIIEEYQGVGETLANQFPEIDLQPILDLLTVNAEIVPFERLAEPVCRDPDDDKFLACALTSGVKYIISGDKDLLTVSGHKGSFKIKHYDGYKGVNPKTLETVEVRPKKLPYFKCGLELKKRLNSREV